MENLKQAVIEQLGFDTNCDGLDDAQIYSTIHDITEHGAMGGFSGFTYYNDTVEFFDMNREAIMELAKNLAGDLGESVYEMIARFNCLNDNYSLDEIVEVLHGVDNDASTEVKNAMSWFALEEVARSVESGLEW